MFLRVWKQGVHAGCGCHARVLLRTLQGPYTKPPTYSFMYESYNEIFGKSPDNIKTPRKTQMETTNQTLLCFYAWLFMVGY